MTGKWKNIYNLDKGMMTSISPLLLPEGTSPRIEGMYIKDGLVSPSFGYVGFPVPGALKTNALNGVVMALPEFQLSTGVSYVLALTTTNAYKYNTSTSTWDDITWGTDVDTCESAWTASAQVTSTADTSVKLQGSYSAKHVIAAAFGTGLVSYYNTGAKDISDTSQHTHLEFWARANAAVTAGVFRLRLSEQVAGGTGATYADYNIPALVVDTWKHCIIDITAPDASSAGTFPDDLNAVLSVGLVAVSDPGTVTIYLDHIKACACFTGDEDDRFSFTTMNDNLVLSNGVDKIMKWTGTDNLALLTTTLAAGAITTSQIVYVAKDHLCFANNTENGVDCPDRVSWGNIGKLEDLIGGTAGYQELTNDSSAIKAVKQLGSDTWAIYKGKSIVVQTWVGGATPFKFVEMVADTNICGKDSVVVVAGTHVVAGENDLYSYQGGVSTTYMEDRNKNTIYTSLNPDTKNRVFLAYLEKFKELQLWIPTTGNNPSEFWSLDMGKGSYWKTLRSMTCLGYFKITSALTIGDLTMTIGEITQRLGELRSVSNEPIILLGDENGKVYRIDEGSLSNNGSVINRVYETPDYSLPDTAEYQNYFMRVPQLLFEASGQGVTAEWSGDGGDSWSPCSISGANTRTLDGTLKIYQMDFDSSVRKIRFRFSNNTLNSGFYLRGYSFYWIPRSGRR